MDDLLPEFLAETNEALAELDLALVRLEAHPGDQPTLALIFAWSTPSRAPAVSSACHGWNTSRTRPRTCSAGCGTASWWPPLPWSAWS